MDNICNNCIHKRVCYKHRLNFVCTREGYCYDYKDINCALTMFGNCSYNKTGCSDCEIKEKIFKAMLEVDNDT